MGLYKYYKEDNLWWGIWKIEEDFQELLSFLPGSEMYEADLQILKNRNKQIERLAVRVLLFVLLGQEKKILYHPSGRPYLDGSRWNISISHTNGYVTVIGSNKGRVGIDIERYGERIRRVAHKFICQDEFLSAYKGTDTWAMLLHWSAKEIMFKCIDREGVDFCKHFRIFPSPIRKKGELQAQEYRTENQYKFLIHYEIEEDFVWAWSLLKS